MGATVCLDTASCFSSAISAPRRAAIADASAASLSKVAAPAEAFASSKCNLASSARCPSFAAFCSSLACRPESGKFWIVRRSFVYGLLVQVVE